MPLLDYLFPCVYHQILHIMLTDCSETVYLVYTESIESSTFSFSCFCCYSLFKFFNYCFESFGFDAILPSQLIFSFMFDVLPSIFKPILNLTQIFPESCYTIFNFPFPVWFFQLFFVGNNTYFVAH